MEIPKVISLLQERIDLIESDFSGDEVLEEYRVALLKAVKALEYREPKKPNMEVRHTVHPVPFCPKCGYAVSSPENDKYCRHCGQAIDWSDEE